MAVSELPAPRELAPPQSGFESRVERFLFRPVDIAFLPFFRIVFGAIMLWHVWRYTTTGAIEYYYIVPRFHFTYQGFEWVRPWPGGGMYLHYAVMAAAAACILLGLLYRLAAVVFFLAFTYTFLLEKALYQNHYYLICLLGFLMIWLPANRAFALDCGLRPRLRRRVAPAWTLGLLRAQIGIPYFYGGLAKLNADWLRGEPIRMGLAERAHFPLVGQWFHEEWMVWFFAYGGVLFDLLVVPALLWRRTRVPAYLVALVFHLINSQMFHIGIFPWFMMGATLVFFPPEALRRFSERLRSALRKAFPPREDGPGRQPGLRPAWSARPADHGSVPGRLTLGKRLTVACLAVWFAVQLLVPLRHYLYAGDVSWTEEGHRFAWHMMLRGKSCGVRFYITDPRTGRTGNIDLRPFLTPRQLEKLGKEADMLVEFSHFLAAELRRMGYAEVEVRALVLVSLNGRRPQLLIDPRVNLAAEPRTWHYPWLLPLTERLRRKAWDVPVTEWERLIFGRPVLDVRTLAPDRRGTSELEP